MGTFLRHYQCINCGQWVTRYRQHTKSKVCLDCGVLLAQSAARELALRSGPAWEAHKRNPGGRPRKVRPD